MTEVGLNAGAPDGRWGRGEQQDFRGRVRGCLLGGAVGDALGAGVAHEPLAAIRQAHGEDGVVDYVSAYGRRGAVTDATQLTLFTVDGLIRAHVRRDAGTWHPPSDVHGAYRRWAATQWDWGPDERRTEDGWLAREEWLYARRAPDTDSLNALRDARMGTLEEPKNPEAVGYGAVLRSAPFGLLVGWEPQLVFQLAVECAAQTHGSPSATLAAGAFAHLVHQLARGQELDHALQRTRAQLATRQGHEEITDALQRAVGAVRQGLPGPERIAGLGKADTAVGMLAIGVYCALVAEDLRHGLLLAVNQDGDGSAAAALCGSLLGTLHGETALPPAWLAELEGRGTLLELADDFAMEMTQGAALHTSQGMAAGWAVRYPREG